MRRASFLILFIIGIVFIAKTQDLDSKYEQDTIWLKSGLVLPCLIDIDSSNNDIVIVYFKKYGGSIGQSRVQLKQVKKIHRLSKPYYQVRGKYRVELENGTTITGNLLSESEVEIEIEVKDLGILVIEKSKIKRLIPLSSSGTTPKSLWLNNPHATRLLFAPTAIPLKKNEGYYQNIYIIGNMFNYGLADNFSAGGGFDFISMFATMGSDWTPFLNFNVKSGFKISEKFHAAVGGIYFLVPNNFSAGLAYGLGTYGTYNSNISLGLGWIFYDNYFEKNPAIMIGAMGRLSEKTYFITENWILPLYDGTYIPFVSYGIRFVSKKIAVDLAFINNEDIFSAIIIGVPYVDFVIKF